MPSGHRPLCRHKQGETTMAIRIREHAALAAGALALAVCLPASATDYQDGVSAPLSGYPAGTFDLGTHLPNYIGPSNGSSADGTNLDGNRVYIYDIDDAAGPNGPAAQADFRLLVWQFAAPKDSVRLYTHQDHYSGGGITDLATAAEVLEYSVFGCNSTLAGGCTVQANWTFLSDPVSAVIGASGPVYTFDGTAATTVYRGGSSEFGLVNAYTQDYTFASTYDFYAIRGSTQAMIYQTADPELDAMVAFNRVDVPPVPEPSTYALLGLGLLGLWAKSRRRA
ncbi:MAG: PEP-CTERM sorting domain-containing protein [Caldimonas sp.]